MLEAVDQMSQEGGVNPRLYQMLLGGLRALDRDNSPVVVPAFFWKLLSLEGYHPILDRCAECGSEGPLVAFDLESGGLLCANDRRGTRITPEAVDLLQRILGGQLGRRAAASRSRAPPTRSTTSPPGRSSTTSSAA